MTRENAIVYLLHEYIPYQIRTLQRKIDALVTENEQLTLSLFITANMPLESAVATYGTLLEYVKKQLPESVAINKNRSIDAFQIESARLRDINDQISAILLLLDRLWTDYEESTILHEIRRIIQRQLKNFNSL